MAQPAQTAQPADYHHYWQYFLALENDLINVSRYIEFRGVDNLTSINAQAHSIELVRIFFAACAECENIFKILAPRPSTISGKDYNITEIKNELQAHHPTVFNQLITTTIQLPIFNISFTPWQDWITLDSPKWWSDHNQIKHNRTHTTTPQYNLAHVYNTLNSVAGLMCLLYHVIKEKDPNSVDYNKVKFSPILTPKLFSSPKAGSGGFGGCEWIWKED
ncbi:MAG: hypothetical protein ACRCU2_30495 [Planktothrix sp.]